MSPGIGIVLSTGRSGTNLVLESLVGNPYFTPTEYPEDKILFQTGFKLPDRYLTKSDTVYIPTYNYLKSFMQNNVNANIIWVLRHPYDHCLSKLYHGRPPQGWDPKKIYRYTDDCFPEGCISNIKWMYSLLKQAEHDYPLRILRVKMEDILLNIEAETKRMCQWLCILWDEDMMNAPKRSRHEGNKKEYGDKIDKSRIDLYKDLDTAYGGYFSDKKSEVQKVFDAVEYMIGEFGYA